MRKAGNLPSNCAVVMKSGNLNFLEPSGLVQACNGTDLYTQMERPCAVFKIALQVLRPLFQSFGTVSFNLCTAFCLVSATVLVTGRQCHCPQTVCPPLSLKDGTSGRHCALQLMDFSAQ